MFPNLLWVLDGGITAGQSCSPEHLQQRHGLLQDLPQGPGVAQQTLHTSIVQNLHPDHQLDVCALTVITC